MNAPAKPKLWTATFVLLVAASLFTFMAGQGLNAGTSVFLALKGEPTTLAGMLAMTFSISSAVGRLVLGPVIDDRGRYVALVGGGAVMLAGTFGPVLLSGLAPMLVFRMLQGVGFSAITTAAAAAAADVVPQERLGEGIGYYGLGQAIATSVGPALALFLVDTNPAENLYVGLTLIMIVALAVMLPCRYERNPRVLPKTATYRLRWEQKRAAKESAGMQGDAASATSEVAGSPAPEVRGWRKTLELRALPGSIPTMILAPAFGFGIFFMGLYGTTLGVGNAGLFFTVSAVVMIVIRLKSGAFMDRVAPVKLFTVAAVSELVCFTMLLNVGVAGEWLYYFSAVFYGMCLGIALPVGQAVCMKNTPPDRWGAASSLYQLSFDVSIGFASFLWGFTNDTFGFSVTIYCVMACVLLSLIAAWKLYPKTA